MPDHIHMLAKCNSDLNEVKVQGAATLKVLKSIFVHKVYFY